MTETNIDDKPYPPYSSLIIRGKELEPEKITKMLGIIPRKSFRRGDKRQNANKEWPHGLWIFESSQQLESIDPIMHIQWLLEQLEPARKELIELSKDDNIDAEISCFWIMPSSHEVLIIDPELLHRIASLNIRFELSVFAP